jgi:hypothetical protein
MDAIRTVPPHEDPLWVRLSHYSIGPADAALPFPARLARENGWNLSEAERVIGEYKRFCYLAMRAGHVVTPSDAVDQTWHLHLTYSRDYWERFCPEILGGPLHHGPTTGGAAEDEFYYEHYAQTLKSYERLFGVEAPADLWPDARRRFYSDPKARRVHPRDGLLLSWRALLLCGAALLSLLFVSVLVLLLQGG